MYNLMRMGALQACVSTSSAASMNGRLVLNLRKIQSAGNTITNKRLNRSIALGFLSAALYLLIYFYISSHSPRNINWWIWDIVCNVALAALALLAIIAGTRTLITLRKAGVLGLDISTLLIVLGTSCFLLFSLHFSVHFLASGAFERDTGMLYYNGYLVKQDYARAETLLRSSYNKGDGWAGIYLATLYVDDDNPNENDSDAITLYSQLANSENAAVSKSAIRSLATHYLRNDSDAASVEKGIEYASRLGDISDSGLDSEEYEELRLLLANAVSKDDHDYAVKLYQAVIDASPQGNDYGDYACYALASLLIDDGDYKGAATTLLRGYTLRLPRSTNKMAGEIEAGTFNGIDLDLPSAKEAYEGVVEAGDNSSQYGHALFSLARIFDEGAYGVEQDRAKALDLYKMVIESANADVWDKSLASFYLAWLYMNGLGTETDYANATQILMNALTLTEDDNKRTDGEEEARGYVLLRLGDCYADSSWAGHDPAKALEAYNEAAALKRADYWVASSARKNIASMYAEGSGVERDVERAMGLLQEALGFTKDDVSANSGEAIVRATVFATMGRLYWDQEWSGHSFAKAAECYYRAVKLNPDEQFYRESLAVLIEGGFGIAKNPELAERIRSGQDFVIEGFE